MIRRLSLAVLVTALVAGTAAANPQDDKWDKRDRQTQKAGKALQWCGAVICTAAALSGHGDVGKNVGKPIHDAGSKISKAHDERRERDEKIKKQRDRTSRIGDGGGKRERTGRGMRESSNAHGLPPRSIGRANTKPQRIAPQHSPRPTYKKR